MIDYGQSKNIPRMTDRAKLGPQGNRYYVSVGQVRLFAGAFLII